MEAYALNVLASNSGGNVKRVRVPEMTIINLGGWSSCWGTEIERPLGMARGMKVLTSSRMKERGYHGIYTRYQG
jgi:hypothetical protein